jgi:hypothetical protein
MVAESPLLGLDEVLELADQELGDGVLEPIPAAKSFLDLALEDSTEAVPKPAAKGKPTMMSPAALQKPPPVSPPASPRAPATTIRGRAAAPAPAGTPAAPSGTLRGPRPSPVSPATAKKPDTDQDIPRILGMGLPADTSGAEPLIDLGTISTPLGETEDLFEVGRIPSPTEATLNENTVDVSMDDEMDSDLSLPVTPAKARPGRPSGLDLVPSPAKTPPISRQRSSSAPPKAPRPALPSRPGQPESVQLATARVYGEADLLATDGLPADERIRGRINFFFERAQKEFSNGNSPLAAGILELALDENPDSVVAQKAIQANRDLILEIYRGYLGNLKAVVRIALPMQQLSKHDLDPRAAFLLSRIDGTMSVEDILDISGMPNLEAFQLLSRLRMQGIIDLR